MFDHLHSIAATRRPFLLGATAVALAFPVIALASPLDVPHSFTDGNVIAAAEFNENFDAVSDAVNDNDARITALENAIADAGVPAGTIAFFASDSCPTGWAEHADLRGRVAVGLPQGGAVSATVGTALGDGESMTIDEVPSHSHTVNPPNTNTTLEAAHTHGVNPAAATFTTTLDGQHDHSINLESGNSFGTFGAVGQTDNAGGSSSPLPIDSEPDHTHDVDVDIPAFTSGAGSSHQHAVDIMQFDSGLAGVGTVDVTMPYVQLLACEKQ